MHFLKRIYRLLLPEERKTGGKVAVTVFVTALLDFVGLAALLPILYYLLEGGENRQAALWFSNNWLMHILSIFSKLSILSHLDILRLNCLIRKKHDFLA